MVKSQNDWTAYPDTKHFTRGKVACSGGEFAFWAANDDVNVVFTEFIQRFDKEVESVVGKTLDDWSYANRLVRDSTTDVSNHGSATAIDLNALKHPRGKHNTFSVQQRITMRQIKNAITDNAGDPVLRLGMDYTSTVDDMHIEINANAARVKQAADKIRKRNAEKEEDMAQGLTWAGKEIPLTATDAAVWTAYAKATNNPATFKAGDLVSLSDMVRYPTLERKSYLLLLEIQEALKKIG